MPGACVVTARSSTILPWRTIVCGAAVLTLLSGLLRADDRAAAERMLAAYEQTVSALASFHIECVARQWDYEALIEIPNGTPVRTTKQGEAYVWKDGNVE